MNWVPRMQRALLMGLVLLAPSARAATADLSFQRVELAGTYPFPVYANHDLGSDLSAIEQIVFVFHGLQRDGDAYFEAAQSLAANAHVDPATTLLIAPNFFDHTDTAKRSDLGGLPLWNDTGWMQGDVAVAGPTVSSFAVIDDLIQRFTDHAHLPKLRRIVIAGHSGGAQLVDRYAALNHADERIRGLGIDLSYVIANPSSYLYFTPVRPSGSAFVPYSLGVCPAYDQYRYGMQQLVPYANGASSAEVFRTFAKREVSFLWGTDDIDPNQRVLDKSCGAEAQGPSRYVRGHSFWRYEHLLDHDGSPLQHRAFDVVGVGHDQARMLGSKCAAALLFGPQTTVDKGADCVAVDAQQ
jgi:hypothetical protein